MRLSAAWRFSTLHFAASFFPLLAGVAYLVTRSASAATGVVEYGLLVFVVTRILSRYAIQRVMASDRPLAMKCNRWTFAAVVSFLIQGTIGFVVLSALKR